MNNNMHNLMMFNDYFLHIFLIFNFYENIRRIFVSFLENFITFYTMF